MSEVNPSPAAQSPIKLSATDDKLGVRVEEPSRTVSVIDIGASSIRMAVAELRGGGKVRKLDQLVQPIQLGLDTFETRKLSRKSIEQVVVVLRNYKRVLREYGIKEPRNVRVVATSAVQEASNRLQFIDRVFTATGFEVEPIDSAEVNRITYMGITPQLLSHEHLANGKALVLEVGGGSTEALMVRSGNVLASKSFRLGALRMLQTVEQARAGSSQKRPLLENQIKRAIQSLADIVSGESQLNLVAIGGDIRLASRLVSGRWKSEELVEIKTQDLIELTDRVTELEDDQLVKQFGTTFVEAQTLGPALLAYSLVAQHFDVERVFVSDTNLRDGLLKDIAAGGSWTAEFRNQIIRSALSLGRRFHFDEMHARSVAELTRKLYGQLRPQHLLDSRQEVILYVAALLHEIGMQINVRSHHKHALYIIRNSELFGLSRAELLEVGLVARYYRRATPQPSHSDYMSLDRDTRVCVNKLAAILRLATALDDTRTGRIRDVQCTVDDKRLTIRTPGVRDVSMEQLAIRNQASLFREVYGKSVVLHAGD
ncbi:MAG: Ppx/GppA phosphatase family protein [Planctomycetota bacterium]